MFGEAGNSLANDDAGLSAVVKGLHGDPSANDEDGLLVGIWAHGDTILISEDCPTVVISAAGNEAVTAEDDKSSVVGLASAASGLSTVEANGDMAVKVDPVVIIGEAKAAPPAVMVGAVNIGTEAADPDDDPACSSSS